MPRMDDTKIPAALGARWNGKVYIQAELTRLDGQGPDAKRWRAVLDKYSASDAAAANLAPIIVRRLADSRRKLPRQPRLPAVAPFDAPKPIHD
jgi:hypothetical protein